MKYMLLIYGDERLWTDEKRQECYAESLQLAHTLKARGQYIAASPLQMQERKIIRARLSACYIGVRGGKLRESRQLHDIVAGIAVP